MTSNELRVLVDYYVKYEHTTYEEAVSLSITDILDYINTDMSILQLCRQQWYNRKTAGTLTDEFTAICKELADVCKHSISARKQLLQV